VVVDFGERGERAARPGSAGVLGNAQRRGQTFDEIHVGSAQMVEQGAGVAAQSFEVAALPLGVQGVEGEGAFARAAGPGQHGQPVARQIHVYVMQVVLTRPADAEPSAAVSHHAPLDGPGNRGKDLVSFYD
jgi:hypothetical protein